MYYDALEEIEKNIPSPIDPNSACDFDYTLIATLNSSSDVDNFCNKYNHSNNYNGLKLGNKIKINDGYYNESWYIAGFDMEHNGKAFNGSSYDNGYGICLVPANNLLQDVFHISATSAVPYMKSTMHTSTLPSVANNLKRILNNHLVNRNVLLGDSVNSTGYTATYTWTTTYCTLMSYIQMDPFSNNNLYYNGDGEASYVLPLFKFLQNPTFLVSSSNSSIWLRTIYGRESLSGSYVYRARVVGWNNNNLYASYNSSKGVRPMIYIR